MTEHTPLPWSWYDQGPGELTYIISEDKNVGCPTLASVHGFDIRSRPGEQQANAVYIVQACNSFPDLLKACKILVEAIDGYERRTGNLRWHSCVDAARAAIAKAEGRYDVLGARATRGGERHDRDRQ